MEAIKYLLELIHKIPNWEKDISSGNIKGTGIEGIAHKASSRIEFILREALHQYIDICNLQTKYFGMFPNDNLDKLTLGNVIHRIHDLRNLLKNCPNYYNITKGKLLSKAKLMKINELRILLEHNPDENEAELISNTKQLLDYINEILNHPFFNILRK